MDPTSIIYRFKNKIKMNYVKNEDESIDILIRIVKDSNPDAGCSECCFKNTCKLKQFKKARCFIESIFGLKKESLNCHIEMVI